MQKLLYAAGSEFLRVFAGSLLVFAPGILAAPNLNSMYLLGVGGLIASLAAGIRSVQRYVPQLTVGHWIGQPFGAWADAFLRGAVASLLTLLPGVLEAPDLETGKGLAVALVAGAMMAGMRALQGVVTRGEWPARELGLADPPEPPQP